MKIKNNQSGFISIVVTIILGLVLVGGGVYTYKNMSNAKKIEQVETVQATTTSAVVSTTTVQEPVVQPAKIETKTELAVNTPVAKTAAIASASVTACSSENCFVSAIDSCSPTKFNRSTNAAVLGSEVETNFDFEIMPSGKSCKFQAILRSAKISPSKEVLAGGIDASELKAIYEKSNADAQLKVGQVGVCSMNTAELRSGLKRHFLLTAGGLMYGDGWLLINTDGECKGGVFTQ